MFNISRNVCLFVFMVLAFVPCFALAAVVAFAFYYDSLSVIDYIIHPSLLISSYKDWAADVGAQRMGVFVLMPIWFPLLGALGLLVLLRKLVLRSLDRVFASDENVQDMGLFDGAWMAFGQLGGKKIQIDTAFSALVWGEKGVGKTSCIAVPSVLESDVGNLLIMDESGLIAKLTSGYRAQIGTVFYLDFDEQDDIAAGIFGAKWNPLSASNVPPKGAEREEYAAIIARNLVTRENDYWGKMASAALEALLMCFIEKVEQATANDYFVDKILSKMILDEEDIDILISHYAGMPKKFAIPAIAHVREGKVSLDSYLPIGSWSNIPNSWQGKELSMAMISDCLLQLYLSFSKGADEEDFDGWKKVLEYFINEAKLFGYNANALNMLEYMFYLSRKQRKILFALMMDTLSMFRNPKIRAKTSISDFSNEQLRGLRDVHGNLRPVTVYIKAASEEAKMAAKFMLKVIADTNIKIGKSISPLAVVIDDFEKFGQIRGINWAVGRGGAKNVSFLIIGQDLEKIKNNYNEREMEEFVSKTGYKIFMANSSGSLIKQLDFVARYASKAVQIPLSLKTKKIRFAREVSDVYYYSQVAKIMNRQSFGRGSELIFAEGYYYLPIKANQLFYQQKEDLRNKAKIPPVLGVDELHLKLRNMQDINSPSVEKVLDEIGVKIKTSKEVNDYMQEEISSASKEISRVADKEAMLTEDISSRWKTIAPDGAIAAAAMHCDWWMEDDAFDCKYKEDMNLPK